MYLLTGITGPIDSPLTLKGKSKMQLNFAFDMTDLSEVLCYISIPVTFRKHYTVAVPLLQYIYGVNSPYTEHLSQGPE